MKYSINMNLGYFLIVECSYNSHYEEYLDAKFPFGSYTQVFLAPEMAVSSSSLGASVSIFSSQVLYDERVIDQVCSFITFAISFKKIFLLLFTL